MRKQAKLLANFLGATKEFTSEYAELAGLTDRELKQIAHEISSRANRPAIARALSAKGYSTRDIAGITGWDYTTISRDLKRVADATKSVANATPAAKSKTSRGAKDARAAAVAAAADEGGITWEQQHDPAAAPGSRPRR